VAADLDELSELVAPRLLVDDVTPEKLGSLLAQHGSLAVIAAESALIDTLVAGRYSEGKANLHLVCAAYSGEPSTIDRKSHDTEYLERPLLAITLVVQPHVLTALLDHEIARAQGLVARFAYALPETRLGHRDMNPPIIPADVSNAWATTVRRVAQTADDAGNEDSAQVDVSNVSSSAPMRITLAREAELLMTGLREEIEPRLGQDGDLHTIADWTARHHGRVARIAALLHLCESEPKTPITAHTMRAALRIGEYLLAHGIAAFTAPDEMTQRALRWLERRGETTVTQRELHRGPLGGRGKSADAERLAAKLLKLGITRELPNEHSTSRRYRVHPALTQRIADVTTPVTRRDETRSRAELRSSSSNRQHDGRDSPDADAELDRVLAKFPEYAELM
jgi:hypothetical protein